MLDQISIDSLRQLLNEREHLRAQVDNLQGRCTELLLENRELKKLREPPSDTNWGTPGVFFAEIAKAVHDEDSVSLNIEVPEMVATYAPHVDKAWTQTSGGHICSAKICETEGCEALHPNACATDPSVDGWKCVKHERKTFDQKCADAERLGAAAGRMATLLAHNPKFFQEAAHGLRKLAAKYPEMPADDECGETSRGYYEYLAEQLEKLT